MGGDGGEGGAQHLPALEQGVQQEVIVHGDEAGHGLEGKVQEMGHLDESIVQLIGWRNCSEVRSGVLEF